MSIPGSLLAGAGDRLLPASVPFQFFIGACIFHPLAWGALFLGAEDLPYFSGGPGYVLASIHLLTLGVLAMSAMGASFQLLPVVTLKPLRRVWPARLCFWLFMPGIFILSYGMVLSQVFALSTGAVLVLSGLSLFLLLTADNLRRAGNVPVVAAHGWGAMAALIVISILGLLLALDFEQGFLEDHQLNAIIHMIVAIFGFMGLLVVGFSLVLVPMFALSRSLSNRQSWLQLVLVVAAITIFSLAMLLDSTVLMIMAVITGIAGLAVHFNLMRNALKSGMRKRLGLSFVLVKSSWGILALGLFVGVIIILELPIPNHQALFGFILLAGWLLTFLMGILQRIMPFLASMHAAGASGMPPMLSDLTAEGPLKVHAICHFAALVLCSVGIVSELTIIIEAGAVLGLCGSLSFLIFAVKVVIGLRKQRKQA